MTRLRHPPSKLAPRVLALCLVTSLALLWHDGATPAEAGALVITTLPLDPDGTVMLRVLLGKVAASFILISCSLATGLSFALALAMGASWLGGRAARFTGWIGRMLAGVPPMGWALGAIVWLIQRRGLPVETLFPYEPPPESDTLALRVGRTLWAWIVPVLVLAIPALGRGLFSLAHKLSSLLHEPVVDRLRARGLRHSQILYRHLVPILRVQLARLARPAAALLLAFDIPVEELLGFDGWGRFAATTLLSPAPSPHALAAVFWAGGLLLAGVLGWLSLLDRQGLPQEAEQDFDPTERRSMRSACCGAGLILALLLPVRWFVPENLRRRMEDAFVAQSFEILRALGVSLAALALVVAASFLMNLLRSRVIGRGWAAALALMPLLAVLLFWDKACGRQGWAIVLVVAIPGFVASREVLGDADESDFIEASRSLGQTRAGIWWRHVLPGVLPSLPGLALRNAGTVMMMFCVLDFYAASGAASWGGQMRLHTGHILDDALPALAPAVLLMLLGLSFRLLSRAFGDGPPSSGARPLQP